MIVGFGYILQAGKDTAAQVLVNEFGFRRVGFADKLKDALYALNPTFRNPNGLNIQVQTAVDAYGWENAKKRYPEIRTLLQRMGTEVGRNLFGKNFWIDQCIAGIKNDENVVIPDVRFPNEADTIKNLGGYVIQIFRPGYEPSNHPSEFSMVNYDRWDSTLRNHGTIEDLWNKVFHALGMLDEQFYIDHHRGLPNLEAYRKTKHN